MCDFRIYLAVTVLACGAAAPMSASPASDAKATEILAAARKAIGDRKLDALKTFSAEAKVQRNVGSFQMSSDVDLVLEMPDKYVRSENTSGGPMPMNLTTTTGFNGDTPITSGGPGMGGGGVVMFRMGPGGVSSGSPNQPELTPEQKEQVKKASLRSARNEISRLMLGWFAMAHPSINAEYTYSGEAESPDGKADIVDVKGVDGFAARLFIDKQTRLPLMLSFQAPKPRIVTTTAGPGGGRAEAGAQMQQMHSEPPTLVENRLYFADWTDMDGIKFPQHIQRSVDGTTQEEWTVARVRINPKVDPKKFESQG